jgi:peptidoglycan/LPS O-acetylase OafA/YrhL
MVAGSVHFPSLAPFASFGWVGVEIFFVLSGLVIAYSAEGKSGKSFATSRFLRLYPAAWICSTLTAAVLVAAGMFSPVAYIKSMLLWPTGKWVTGAYWTLGVEMAFYALVFLLLRFNRFDRVGNLFAILAVVSTGFWLAWLALHLSGGSNFLASVTTNRAAELALIVHGCYFALGGLMWLTLFKATSAWRTVGIGVSLVGSVICIYAFAIADPNAVKMGHSPLVPIFVWLAAVALMWASVRWNVAIGAAVPARASRSVGLATYPLYLLHNMIGAYAMRTLVGMGWSGGAALAAAICLVLALSFATLPSEEWLRDKVRPWVGSVFERFQRSGAMPRSPGAPSS